MLLEIKFLRICKTIIYGCLNISRVTFLLITPKSEKSVKIFPLKIFGLSVRYIKRLQALFD